MTTSSAPCTTLSVMTTMSDLIDDFRLHAFAAGLSLLHHRFDRAQVFVDFANKSADAPAVGAGARGEQHEERRVDLECARQRAHAINSIHREWRGR